MNKDLGILSGPGDNMFEEVAEDIDFTLDYNRLLKATKPKKRYSKKKMKMKKESRRKNRKKKK